MRLHQNIDPVAAPSSLEAWDGKDEPLAVVEVQHQAPPSAERVLLAEDDAAIRRLYRVMLERRGFEVVEAANGQEAVLYARTQAFDLVIADLNMPKLDGWGVLSHLREDCRTRDVPVAFLSCEDDFRESLRAQQVGARAYISKGTRLELIAQEVQLLCEPARRLRRLLRAPMIEPAMVGELGAVPLLRELHRARWTGVLRAIGSWVQVELAFDRGTAVRADARSGEHEAHGVIAFNAFVGCERFEAMLGAESSLGAVNLHDTAEALLEGAISVVNKNQARSAERALVEGRVSADAGLYQLFSKLASPEARETARQICEEKLTPAQVLASSDRSPLEVEAELQELHRRGLLKMSC